MRILALLLLALPAFAQHTYYISKVSGSDTRTSTQAQSKSTPWAHLPGMNSCSSACASYSPVAGDQFILKGGETWVASDLGVAWQWGGNSSSRIYIGVDQTWFTGSSWARPIFNCGGATCSNNNALNNDQMWITGPYVTVDNIEFTGLLQNNGAIQAIATFSDHTEVEHNYIHGWARAVGQTDNGSSFAIVANTSDGAAQVAGASFHDNVIDGSDTTQDMFNGIEAADSVYNNVIRYVVSGILTNVNDVHANLVENNVTSYAGDHCNLIFIFGPFSGTHVAAYNNVVRNGGCSGGEVLWLNGELGSACSGCTVDIYNNVVYNSGRGIDLGSHPNEGNSGTFNVYNNTVESGGQACLGNGEASPRSTTNYANNHCINVSTICDGTGTTCINAGGNLSETTSQATTAGYTSSQTLAYSPTSGSRPTVGAGQNLTSSCASTVIALCASTVYPEYDATHHTVTFTSTIARPSSGAWDTGAYEFSAPAVATPKGVGGGGGVSGAGVGEGMLQ